jgi:hypothetical protein
LLFVSGSFVCSPDLKEFEKLKQLIGSVMLLEPEDSIWAQYWRNVYNRVERLV